MLVQEFLEYSADRLPDKVALVGDGQRLSYGEVEAQANRLANALIEEGLQRGDRVVLYLPNILELAIAIFAVLKAGGVFVPLNPSTKYDKCCYILNHCQAGVLVTTGRQADLVRELVREVPSLKTIVLTSLPDETPSFPFLGYGAIQCDYNQQRPPKVNIDLDLACLIYTSGSTGDPKGVMSDHSNVVFAASSIIEYLGNVESDIVICLSPLSFDYGLYQLLMVFKFGGTLILEKGFTFPAAILKRIEEERVTGFPGVPTIYAMLLKMDLSPYDLSSLRYLTNTAAALPGSHIMEIRARFPGVKLFSMYGLTETKRTLYLPPEQLDTRPNSVGIAIPGTEVWIEDEEGKRLGVGEVGELVVRGSHVMRGYWEDPEQTAIRFRPGSIPGERVCYTGDLFRMDDEGFMYFVSRKDDIIKSRGEKVAPKEVENVIYGLSGVREVAVIGVPDSVFGEAVKAFVVVEENGISQTDILRHCRTHLEDFMVPKYVELRSELPKTPSGKIKKTDLS
ncbi:MAG TPA: AMP-dependent synthetase [Cyanobacteria bacterium UBA11159]|nr:AMP-dependent synthetase [Cyanobacteria bacterium UBA11367]HBE59638.1 AMP-dependent synthetase [Cyanobacteria bacterium UBA11366]HBR77088.1 AMP-dependent synthetase [Cyanobacteria bacterium UBA11159]HBS69056.1 AMP-dependent synthetase [Cyanobacteria bacterium UBA11153]HCA94797.1 AMP-dependent synthetase [Cyanobacteria bacterium UBA9226]